MRTVCRAAARVKRRRGTHGRCLSALTGPANTANTQGVGGKVGVRRHGGADAPSRPRRRFASSTSSSPSEDAARARADPDKERLTIFDTTLRDGEQSPGATLNLTEKLQIARQLSRLGVDVCEAGFPIASPGDFEAVKTIARAIGPMTDNRPSGDPMRICGLSRATEKDIERCFNAVKYAPRHRIHTFLATSDIHLEHKLGISRSECVENAARAVAHASALLADGEHGDGDIEFSPEDAGRSDPAFLVDVLTAVIEAGATTLNIPDTVGFVTPGEYGDLFERLIAETPGGADVMWSTHCHDDLGLATANTLAAVLGGARQVEVTLNGIGERAGNTSLEEVVMALWTRPREFPVYAEVDTTQIMRTSRMVSAFTGMAVQPNKAIVGANAFSHEAGIHQDGVLKHQETYEIMSPESVGLTASNLVLGKHSGRHAYAKRLAELGFDDLTPEEIEDFTDRFKVLADEKKVVTDADIEAIVLDQLYQPESVWTLDAVHVTGGNRVKATATVSLEHADGHEVSEAAIGTGPVDAVFQAVRQIVNTPNKLIDFSIKSVTGGIDALGEVIVKIERVGDEPHGGEGAGGAAAHVPASHASGSLQREASASVAIGGGGPASEYDEGHRLMRSDSAASWAEFKNPQTGVVKTRQFTGIGADVDIIVASAKAYINALNRMLGHEEMEKRRLERRLTGTNSGIYRAARIARPEGEAKYSSDQL